MKFFNKKKANNKVAEEVKETKKDAVLVDEFEREFDLASEEEAPEAPVKKKTSKKEIAKKVGKGFLTAAAVAGGLVAAFAAGSALEGRKNTGSEDDIPADDLDEFAEDGTTTDLDGTGDTDDAMVEHF